MLDLVTISDTHNLQESLELPSGDVLIHAGDWTIGGHPSEIHAVADWFKHLLDSKKFKYIVSICGNHDFFMEENPLEARQYFTGIPGLHYLENSSVVIDGYKFYGSPQQPWYFDYAFNVPRGAPIRKYWDAIPIDTDVLITHGPPWGFCDDVWIQGKLGHAGCEELAIAIERIQPKYAISGHLHQGYGTAMLGKTMIVNAAVTEITRDHKYKLKNEPICLTLK